MVCDDVKELDITPVGQGTKVEMLRIRTVRPDPNQPRKHFDETALRELADSIADIGIRQPLEVQKMPPKCVLHEPDLTTKEWRLSYSDGRPGETFLQENTAIMCAGGDGAFRGYYQIISGERRWRAAQLAELDSIPCKIAPGIDPKDKFKVQHAENEQREALSPMDEADSYHRAVYTDKLFTAEELAKELGKSRSHVFGRLKLATLPAVVKEAVAKGELNAALAQEVAKIPGELLQVQAMKEIQEGGPREFEGEGHRLVQMPMSVRDAQRHIRESYTLDLDRVQWDLKDAELIPEIGACTKCPKRSGNCKELFPDLKSPNVCTDLTCYGLKSAATVERAKLAAEKAGMEIVPKAVVTKMFQYSTEPQHKEFLGNLDRVCSLDKKERTIKQILGKDAPKPMAAITTKGETFKVWKRDEVAEALREKGIKVPVETQGDTGEGKVSELQRREAEFERKMGVAVENALGYATVIAAEKPFKSDKAEREWWINYLECVTRRADEGQWDWQKTFKRRDIEIDRNGWTKLPVETMRGIAVEISLLGNSYFDQDRNFDGSIGETAKMFGVDVKAVEKQAKKDFEEANRLPTMGEEFPIESQQRHDEINGTHSADKITEGKLKGLFEFRGAMWVNTGSTSGTDQKDVLQCQRVVPTSEFKGKAHSYKNHNGKPGETFYEGIAVSCGGTDYVLVSPEINFVWAWAKPPEAAKSAKGKKK